MQLKILHRAYRFHNRCRAQGKNWWRYQPNAETYREVWESPSKKRV